MTLGTRIRDNRAIYTVAGAGDLAVEKLREVPEQMTKVREVVSRYQGEFRENVNRFQERVEVKDLPGAAMAYVTHVSTRTVEVIDELAERGKKVVHRTDEEVAEVTEAKGTRAAGRKPQQVQSRDGSARKDDA